MIPIRYDEDGNLEEVTHAYNPFKRGVMEFDDYNYAVHNPYVLVEDPKEVDDEKTKPMKEELALASQRSSVRVPPAGGAQTAGQEGMEQAFSQKNVNSSVTEEYEHPLVTIAPSEMELEKAEAARQAAIAEEEAAKEKAKKEQEKAKRKGSKASLRDGTS